MSDNPSISIGSITGGQNNIGKTEIAGDQVQHNHYGASTPTLDRVLDAVSQSVPSDVREELLATVINPIKDETDAAATQLADIDELAASDQKKEESVKVKATLVERVTSLAAGLQPYAPMIAKALVAFGETSLVAMQPPAGWVAGALLAAVKAMSAGGGESNSAENE